MSVYVATAENAVTDGLLASARDLADLREHIDRNLSVQLGTGLISLLSTHGACLMTPVLKVRFRDEMMQAEREKWSVWALPTTPPPSHDDSVEFMARMRQAGAR